MGYRETDFSREFEIDRCSKTERFFIVLNDTMLGSGMIFLFQESFIEYDNMDNISYACKKNSRE